MENLVIPREIPRNGEVSQIILIHMFDVNRLCTQGGAGQFYGIAWELSQVNRSNLVIELNHDKFKMWDLSVP